MREGTHQGTCETERRGSITAATFDGSQATLEVAYALSATAYLSFI